MAQNVLSRKVGIPLRRGTITVAILHMAIACYPVLKTNAKYMRLFEYLVHGCFRDKTTGFLVIDQYTLALIEGCSEKVSSGNYCGQKFLDEFCSDVFNVEYSNWSYGNGTARMITATGINPDLAKAIQGDLNIDWTPENRVYFTGEKITRKSRVAMREEEHTYALLRMAEANCEEAIALLSYMNNLPANRFTKAIQHIEEAVLVAFRLPNEVTSQQQVRMLRSIASQPVPYYAPSGRGRTVRIFPVAISIASLKSSVRAVLCQSWLGLDLVNSQLAICASVWGVQPVIDFLEGGGVIWESLFAHFGWTTDAEIKAMFKRATYATLFGGSKDTIRDIFADEGMEEHFDHYFAHTLVAAMWQARTARLTQIGMDRGATDCFGNWIATPWENNRPNTPSVLAALAQATELKLMLPILELAKSTDEFQIVLWLHDGCYVDFKDASKAERWTRRIIEAVNNNAKTMGIPTRLEVKD